MRLRWRRKWLLVPFVIIAVTTVVVTRRLPNGFVRDGHLVVPQQIPENYVQPTVKARLEDRLASSTSRS